MPLCPLNWTQPAGSRQNVGTNLTVGAMLRVGETLADAECTERKQAGRETSCEGGHAVRKLAAGRGATPASVGVPHGEGTPAEEWTPTERHRRTTSIESVCGRSDGISSSVVPVSNRFAADSSAADSTTI